MSDPPRTQYQKGVVKQILSGDSLIIRGQPRGGPPPEKNVGLSGISAPRLARRQAQDADSESSDEPYAWECREFLRTLVVGKDVHFTLSSNKTPSGKEFGSVFIMQGGELKNVVDLLISEGLVEVRKTGPQNEEMSRLSALEDNAKAGNKGKWGPNAEKHVRNIPGAPENMAQYVDKHHGKELNGIVEYVRDACTMRVLLLPGFEVVGVMLAGIKCPGFKREDNTPEPFAAEAKFFVESRLLQRNVKLRIEGSSNQYILGTILHPAGSISEALLQEGFGHCVDWSIGMVITGKDKLRAAERAAKEKRVRRWKDFKSSAASTGGQKQYSARVMEVINADALRVKLGDGTSQKIFLSSLRGPRANKEAGGEENKRGGRPLYDVPYMYEAREFLRTKLIHKKVNVTVDYVRPAQDNFPEKVCATVLYGETNIAEALISKGLATVMRHRQDDEERSLVFDDLLTAESRAKKQNKGIHQKKDSAPMRVADLSGDSTKAKQFLSSLQRQGRISGIVEYVANGARLRVFLPKDTSTLTLLLAGVACPRMQSQRSGQTQEGEPFGDEAHTFTRDLCLQREIVFQVDNVDRAGNFIGWAFVDEKNISLELVTLSLAKVHFSADKTVYATQLYNAEEICKRGREKIWENYEPPAEVPEETVTEETDRKVNQQKVVVSHADSAASFWVQKVENGPQLESLMEQLNQELTTNPPTAGAYSPKRNDKCAALYSDGMWYRVQVEKITSKDEIQLLYIDYGNKETQRVTTLCPLPVPCSGLPGQATMFALACARPPPEEDWLDDSLMAFQAAVDGKELLMNAEYRVQGQPHISLRDPSAEVPDICKRLLEEGLLIVDKRRDRHLEKLVAEYIAAEQSARSKRVAMWVHGDITDDDAKEFGYRKVVAQH